MADGRSWEGNFAPEIDDAQGFSRDQMVLRKAFFFDLLEGGIKDESEFSDCPSSELDAAGLVSERYFAENLPLPDFSFAFEILAFDETVTGGAETFLGTP